MSAIFSTSMGKAWWLLVVYGAISALFGISALVHPASAGIALAWAIGVMALAEGIISFVALFDASVRVPRGWLVFYAIASILFGIVAIVQPAAMAGALILLLAAWLVVAGIYRIVFAIRVRKHVSNEWMIALSGVLAIVLGLLLAAFPLAGLIAAMVWIGIGALVYGVLQIAAGLKLRRL